MPDRRSQQLETDPRQIIDAARGVWIRRLIDHSRANSLLFYRNLKVGTLDLTNQNKAIEDLLAGHAVTANSLVSAATSEGNPDPLPRRTAETLERERIRSALIALQRKALSNLEEKGIETLHLAIGMATWPASDSGRPYNAPVLLLPARIETRGRAGDDLRLSVSGEPQVNPVLLYVLEENYAVLVNPRALIAGCAGEEESGQWRVDPDCVLETLERSTTKVPDFTIKRDVILANFQFAKMAMVEDMKKNADVMASSSIIAAIAGHLPSRQRLAEAVTAVEPRQLDDRPPSDDYLVIDADSTQQRAIVLVGKGQNLVVQGPPGTGKSQTIANLIAQSVAEGRRVLFVAEKRAALEAVIKRLNRPNVGLGHLVLDLHGASVSRKDVMARLANALERVRHALPADGADSVHREFDARRKQLNQHARRVNQARQPSGLSVNQMIGRLLRLPTEARSSVRVRGAALDGLTAAKADEVKQWILEGAANPNLLLGTDASPWNNAEITEGRIAQEALDLATTLAFELWPELEGRLRTAIQELGIRPPGTLKDVSALVTVLRDVRGVHKYYDADIFSSNPGELADLIAPAGRGFMARAWAFVSSAKYRFARRRLLALRTATATTATLRNEALCADDVLCRWRALGSGSDVPISNDDDTALLRVFSKIDEAINGLTAMTGIAPFSGDSLTSSSSRLRALATDQSAPYRLPGVHGVRLRLRGAGLSRLLNDLREHGVHPEQWAARFEYIWLQSALEQVLAGDPSLASFKGRTHEQTVADFIRLDRERIRIAAARVSRLHAERAIDAMNKHFDQANLVQTEARKKSRHIPLRELLSRAPDVLTRLAPCWVASPLSVSQLLDGSRRHFDVVIFDEASQILQEEAVPSLYRAEQVVVAGDRHQLPPTTFFATAVEGEDEASDETTETREAIEAATAAIGGFESLLRTLEAFLPNCLLEWHYRSEDERLITFSNSNIYDGRLVTFPSARGRVAIRQILVPHDPSLGGQEESASREVDRVVREVISHAESNTEESLGVITMGIKHANRVQAALDRALQLRSDLADFFSLSREERFFIKNIEAVQGDERDAIILSIGYGKTSNGDLPHRFGPLTQEVGYRRLNVAVTRAKRSMCVISSFSHDEVDLNRSGSRGVKLLKAYLEYAASGGAQFVPEERAGEVELNAFEADVRDALDAKGIITRSQFGASRYRIDLVAMHPRKPGRPVLGIECDGASYHSSATARDRDRLRQEHLQRLGWRFHRIWSTDWFYGREEEIERAVRAYGEAVLAADLSDASRARHPQEDRSEQQVATERPPVERERGPRPLVPVRDSIEQYSDRELLQISDWIASDGLMRTDEEVIREIFDNLPFRRLGGRIRERLQALVRGASRIRRS